MRLTHLSPALLWQHFSAINAIPRPSKQEAALRQYYEAWASEKNLVYKTDAVGNLLIQKPATQGYTNSPKIILQGHIDMVCQKGVHSLHNFEHDPIQMHIENGFVSAIDTTLGADNGIGVAAMLAILEDDTAQHGPLEVLLTVDEEAGMGGVRGLEADWLEGHYLINLDAEEWGACCVGCAGGADILLSKPLNFDKRQQGLLYQLSISGLRGGHSGLDIHTGRANANQLLAEVLADFSMSSPLRLSSFQGGTLRNALTRDASAHFYIDASQTHALEQHVVYWQNAFKKQLQGIDEHLSLRLAQGDTQNRSHTSSLNPQDTHQVLNLLVLLPHGVIAYSSLVDAVETSCNIGVVQINPDQDLNIALLGRSLNPEGMHRLILRAQNLSQLSGVNCEVKNEYPAWNPNLNSKLLSVLRNIYHNRYQQEMTIKVVHAGIETGLIGHLYPDLEMISFGPTILDAHSPDERVEIESVEQFYLLLKELLANLK